MERRRQIRHAVYAVVAVDAAVISVAVLLSRSLTVTLVSGICLPVLLILNLLILRHKLRVTVKARPERLAAGRPRRFSVYACSALFLLGTTYGLLMVSHGQLPRATLALLLVPLSLGVYCLRAGYRARSRKPN